MWLNMGRLAASVAVIVVLATSAGQAQAPRADSAQIQALFQQAERALAERRYAEAGQAYERLEQLQPAVAEVHARLGLIYFQQSRFADAIAPLRRALKLKPSLANVDSLLAMSLSEIGRHDEALPGLEKAFDQKSTDSALRRMAGLHLQRAYTDLGRDSSAVDGGARAEPELSRRSGSALPRRTTVRELRLSPDGQAGAHRAGLGVAASGCRRSEREPGAARRRRSGNISRCWRCLRTDRASISVSGGCSSARSMQAQRRRRGGISGVERVRAGAANRPDKRQCCL